MKHLNFISLAVSALLALGVMPMLGATSDTPNAKHSATHTPHKSPTHTPHASPSPKKHHSPTATPTPGTPTPTPTPPGPTPTPKPTPSPTASPTPVNTIPTGFSNLKHVIIAMQENHSFDNYFGVIGLAAGSPYHNSPGHCASDDHSCVDGLSCSKDSGGKYTCANLNPDPACTRVTDPSTKLVTFNCTPGDNTVAYSFHSSDYCPAPDEDHGWESSHHEGNFSSPNSMLKSSPNDGFVVVNDATEQADSGAEAQGEDTAIGFYDDSDLPYYYGLAETFAIDDNYHESAIGPTGPNRFFLLAATSFGHTTTSEEIPPVQSHSGGPNTKEYQPVTGTIFDLLDQQGITWMDYFNDLPDAGSFRTPAGPNFAPMEKFFADLQSGNLPQVVFLDPILSGGAGNASTDEHPPHDIRFGQFYMSQVISALRSSSAWDSSILFITYDEHGGFYDHAAPPPAPQGGALNPDGINPGQCEDMSNPTDPSTDPTSSLIPGKGANCSSSQADGQALCPGFDPSKPYPSDCANFNQLGFRVPFIAVSPFSKPQYVSHATGDHTSMLRLIELRWLAGKNSNLRDHLTERDGHASALFDMFDFDKSPSANVDLSKIPSAPTPNLATDGNGDCAKAP